MDLMRKLGPYKSLIGSNCKSKIHKLKKIFYQHTKIVNLKMMVRVRINYKISTSLKKSQILRVKTIQNPTMTNYSLVNPSIRTNLL